MELIDLINAIRANKLRITDHAYEEARADNISLDEIFFSVEHGDILEDYPEDQPYPSCLVMGLSKDGEPIHSVWAFNESTKYAVMITVYRPDLDRWIDWRIRR